jgi:hypothetical protein
LAEQLPTAFTAARNSASVQPRLMARLTTALTASRNSPFGVAQASRPLADLKILLERDLTPAGVVSHSELPLLQGDFQVNLRHRSRSATRELRRTGGTLRRIEPTYTALELADREERERKSQMSIARRAEEQRRERALLVRYPNPAAHERECAEALASLDAILRVARQHLQDLASDRGKIEDELEFYKANPSHAPEALRLRMADNRRRVEAQGRFIAHESEKERMRARFEEERARLTPLRSLAGSWQTPHCNY